MASGLKKMLAQGIANEQEQLEKVASSGKNEPSQNHTEVTPTTEEASVNLPEVPHKQKASDGSQQKNPSKKQTDSSQKKKGGRPTNKEKGVKSRQQYTLTLKPDDYREFLERAGLEDISFAKFMERAAKEYIQNHSL